MRGCCKFYLQNRKTSFYPLPQIPLLPNPIANYRCDQQSPEDTNTAEYPLQPEHCSLTNNLVV